jgi:hemerythrin-like domain-containing protein
MNPIQALMDEHRVIEQVLDALVAYVGRLDEGADPADLARFVEFVRGFADACHHGKEERILFEAMIEAGMPRDQGPIGVMLAEHREGRRLVGILRDEAARAGSWTDIERHRVEDAALAYAALLRSHIAKEDTRLYPMAEARLRPEVLADIAARFERFEAEETGTGEHARLHALAEELIARYAPAGGPMHGHAHHHAA